MRAILAVFACAIGCGGETSSSTPDAALDSTTDAPAEGCSLNHGPVPVGTNAEDGDVVSTCAGGKVCGTTGGLSGFVCCEPGPGCSRAEPEPAFDAAMMGDAERISCDSGVTSPEPGIVASCCSGVTCAGTCGEGADAACECYGVAGGCGAGFSCCSLFRACIPRGTGCHYGAK